MLKAVFHINELEKWPIALGNIRNLLKESQAVSVKIVVNGEAITGYTDSTLVTKMSAIESQVVHFEACQNALRGHQIAVSQLPPWVKPVPAGVLRLIEWQQQGYAYIKP